MEKPLAEKIVDKMYNSDWFSQWLGIERVEVKTGRCVLRMKIRKEMLDGFAMAHGGITYSLADSALAFASNSHGRMSVSVETSISHTEQLKEGDVITKIDETKIEDPDDLSTAIQKHKPGEKVTVTYLRDNKENKATAELTEWKGANVFSMKDGQNFKFDMGDMDFNKAMPRMQTLPRGNTAMGKLWTNSGPKLGLSVQDTDDGKGVKVIEVDDESMSEKAGVKKDDVILEVDGKAVNGTDEISKIIRDSKEKPSIMLKLQRGGKTQNIEVKMPRKIKTTDI